METTGLEEALIYAALSDLIKEGMMMLLEVGGRGSWCQWKRRGWDS